MGTCGLTRRPDGVCYSAVLVRKHGLETQHEQLTLGGHTHPTEMIIIMKLKHISVAKACPALKRPPPTGVSVPLISTTCLGEQQSLHFPPRNMPQTKDCAHAAIITQGFTSSNKMQIVLCHCK